MVMSEGIFLPVLSLVDNCIAEKLNIVKLDTQIEINSIITLAIEKMV